MEPVVVSENNKHTPLFTTDTKSLRLIPLVQGDKEFRSTVLKLNSRANGVAYLPIVKSTDDICRHMKKLFGESAYARYWKRYLVPRRVSFRNPWVTSQTVIKTTNVPELGHFILDRLPELQKVPTYQISGTTNAIFDYSEIFKMILPENPKFYASPKWVTEAAILFPEILSYLLFKKPEVGFDMDSYFQTFRNTFPPIQELEFDAFVVSIPVTTKNIQFYKSYLNPQTAIPANLKKSKEDIFIVSLIRFLIATHNFDGIDAQKNPELFEVASKFKDKNVVFIFHNDVTSFYIDIQSIKKDNLSINQMLTMITNRLQLIIRHNAGVKNLPIEETDEIDIDKLAETIATNDSLEDEKQLEINLPKEEVDLPNFDLKDPNVRIANILANSNRKADKIKTQSILGNSLDKVSAVRSPDAGELSLEEIENSTIPSNNPEEEDDLLIDDAEELVDEMADIADDIKFVPTTPVAVAKQTVAPKLTAAQMRRVQLIREKYKSIQFDDNRTIEQVLNDVEAMTIDSKVPNIQIRDESLKHSSLVDFEKSYVNKTLSKDIVSMVKSFSEDKSLNIHIVNFEKRDTSDQFNERETYIFDMEDEAHKKHRVKVHIPKVDDDGFMYINGNKKVLKKQWLMLPVAKIKPDTVFVSSNFNKVIIFRQGTVLNRNIVILKRLIQERMMDNLKVRVATGNNLQSNSDYPSTIEYDELSRYYHQITIDTVGTRIVFNFNQKELRDYIAKDQILYEFNPKRLPFGIMKSKSGKKVLDLDLENDNISISAMMLAIVSESGVVEDFGSYVNQIPAPKRRVYNRIIIQSKKVPIVTFLGALFTLKGLIDKINHPLITFTQEKVKGATNLSMIRFKDGFLYYPTYPMSISLMLNGLTEMDTENYPFEEFNAPSPYVDYLFDNFKTRNLIKGWTAFRELFLDPITLEILRDYKLPTDFLELFMYASGLLDDNNYTHETDASIYRIRGFEVIPVELYKALAAQYAIVKQRGHSREALTLPEDEILKRLHKSFILENVDALSPTNELKTKSIVTFKGPGGINMTEAFPLDKRAYGEKMIGIIGLPSVDSSAVGIVKQTTIDPRIKSTRGYLDTVQTSEEAKGLAYSQMSTPETASLPFVDLIDDPKRQGFASGQTKHVVPVSGAASPMIGTGFEQAVIYKIGDTFAKKAKEDGRCILDDDGKGIAVVEYKSGKRESFRYGNVLNRNSNMYLGNKLKMNVMVGESFKSGDILTYNEEFFTKQGKRMIMKQGALCRLVILEGESTEEDSSDITQSFAEKMTTTVVKRKQISIDAKANIISYKKVGEEIIHSDPLLIFEDVGEDGGGDTAAILDLLGDVDEATLNSMTRHSPTANETGKIVDMKVYWSVPPDEMSNSVKEFVNKFINQERGAIKFEEDSTNTPSRRRMNVEVSTPYRGRINGAEVAETGGVVIEYFIGGQHAMGPGDKLSYYSSLKSIVAHVIPKEMEPKSEFGDTRVDATLGFMSIGARMVNSIYMAGWMGKIIHDRGKMIANEFFGQMK